MSYDILIPSLPFLGGYLITYTIYRFGLIRKALHVNIWNFIIGLAFIISGGAGFILLILMALGMKTSINYELMYWHVEAGITLTLITAFHLHDHWKATKNMFIPAKKRVKS